MTHKSSRFERLLSGLAAVVVLISLFSYGQEATGQSAPAPPGSMGPAGPAPVAVALGHGRRVGDPRSFDNLTVFPITARHQTDIGPITTLGAALAAGRAEVREVGGSPAPNDDQRSQPQQQRRGGGGGAEVGTLVIENKGKVPIYVLAGTVVKGGNQDRQIGQDFIVAAGKTVPVDAFCVEQGRWTDQRGGAATYGKFSTAGHMANADVRAAGQYKRSQGEVWSKVGEVNDANEKSASSGTLFATLDDKEVARRQAALTAKIQGHLAQVQPRSSVVGFAYAVDGRIKGVRWFINHWVYAQFSSMLIQGASLDAITAQAGKPPKAPPAMKPQAVASFVSDIEAAKKRRRQVTAADNVNDYAETAKGAGSKTRYKPAATAAPAAAAEPVSADYVSY